MLAGHVGVVVTATDSDGDKASTTSTDISTQIVFHDDGPSASVGTAAKDTLVLDESRPIGGDTAGAAAPGGLATITANFGDNFNAVAYGADGAGSTAYSLVLAAGTIGTGLYALDTTDKSITDGDGYASGAPWPSEP